MLEQSSPPTPQLRRVLTNILSAAQKYSYLWDSSEYIPGALPLFTGEICEQDEDYIYYGLTKNGKGKIVFCSAEGKTNNPLKIDKKGTQTSIHLLIKQLQHYRVPIEELKLSFLEEISESLTRYEIKNAEIEEKVRRKIRKLEAELTQ